MKNELDMIIVRPVFKTCYVCPLIPIFKGVNNLAFVTFYLFWSLRESVLSEGFIFIPFCYSLHFTCFSPPGFSLEYTLHIYGDSEREGRLLPGSAQPFRWQVSLGFYVP